MLVISVQWVMVLDLVALIGGIIGGISLMTPQEPKLPVRRQQKEEPPKRNSSR